MKENNIDKGRWKILLVLVVLVGAYLIGGLIWLQVINGKSNAQRAYNNSVRRLIIPASRGVIYDNDDQVLVNSKSGYVISISYLDEEQNLASIKEIAAIFLEQKLAEEFTKLYPAGDNDPDPQERAALFAEFRQEHEDNLLQQLVDNMVKITEERKHFRRFQPIIVAPLSRETISDVSLEIVAAIEGMRSELPNVLVEIYPQRQYKLGNYGFHIFGSVHEIDRVGREGLEKSYDDYLRGTDGMRLVEVNRYNRATNELDTIAPVQGNNLHLTLDKDLQKVAEQALLDAMEKTRERLIRESKSKGYGTPEMKDLPYSGAVVVMDVNTGAVLATASLPQVDRDNYQEIWNVEDPFINRFRPGTNWATGAKRPPGSIVKPLIGIAGIETGVVDQGTTVYCNAVYHGLYNTWRYPAYCWYKPGHGGPIEITAAIKNSCNLYFYPLGEKLGLDRISDYYHKVGFGNSYEFTDMAYKVTDDQGVEEIMYATSVNKGIVYDVAEFVEAHKQKPTSADLAQAGIGQGDVRVNPMQVALFTSMLASAELQDDGTYQAIRRRPYIVERVTDSDGQELYRAEPEILDVVNFDKLALDLAREGMRKVTQEKGGPDGNTGTAFWSFHEYDYKKGYKPVFPFEVAGKTGTAQEVGWENHGWFISYAPYDEPEIAVVMLMDQGRSGGSTGGPVAREIYEEYFKERIAEYRNSSTAN